MSVKYDRGLIADMLTQGLTSSLCGIFSDASVNEQIRLLNDADEEDARYVGTGVVVPKPSIPFDDNVQFILGHICFQCIKYAQVLRLSGRVIEERAEAEQAAVLHWMLDLYMEHGADWRTVAVEWIKKTQAEAENAPPTQEGRKHD